MAFTHLHVHSEYSPKDSIAKIPAILDKVASDGQTSLAVTDHGSIGGAWTLAAEATKRGVKPIPGFEAYLAIDGGAEPTDPDAFAAACHGPGPYQPGVDTPWAYSGGWTPLFRGDDGEARYATREDHAFDTVPSDGPATDGGEDSKDATKASRYHHLTVLATSRAGWRNLMMLHNLAFESHWSAPRIDFDLLAEHSEGIVVLTGCLGGPLQSHLMRAYQHETDRVRRGAQHLAADRDRELGQAQRLLQRLIDAVGRDRVFVEVMFHGIDGEEWILEHLYALAEQYGLPCVATGDSHCVDEDQANAQDAWLAIGSGKLYDDPKRWRFSGDGYHVKTEQEMFDTRPYDPQWAAACANTQLVADLVDPDVVPTPQQRLPQFPTPDGWADSTAYFRHLVDEGARRRYGDQVPGDITERLETEMDVIEQKGFPDYFLIVQDVVRWCASDATPQQWIDCHGDVDLLPADRERKKPIWTGPGRGSAAGAETSYCLGITNVPALRNGLIFERFLTPDSVKMPDIDVDFEQDRLQDVHHFLRVRWGGNRVARVGTYGTSKSKASLKSAARTLGDTRMGETLSALVPMNGTVARPFADFADPDCELGAEFRERAAEGNGPRIVSLARRIEDVKSNESQHASATLIAPEDLRPLIPMRAVKGEGGERIWVTRWEGGELEDFGMLKFDVLGLRNLDIAHRATELLAEDGVDVDLNALDPDDLDEPRNRAAWDMLGAGHSSGVFQLESTGMRKLLTTAKPHRAEDLSTLIALYRPGPMGEGMHTRWASIKAGTQSASYDSFTTDPAEQEVLASELGVTESVIVLQEQLMFLAEKISGFGPFSKSRLQKAVSKKKKADLELLEPLFKHGGVYEKPGGGTEDIPGGTAAFDLPDGTHSPAFAQATLDILWETFRASGEYLFNKAHSAAYGQLAYWTAYLKANWPATYGAALLTLSDKAEHRSSMLAELRGQGIDVTAPDVNIAHEDTRVIDGRVVYGIGEVKGIADKDAHKIVAEREAHGPFESFRDVMGRMLTTWEGKEPGQKSAGASVGALATLAEAGGLDEFGSRRAMVQTARGYTAPSGKKQILAPMLPDPAGAPDWNGLERANRQRVLLSVILGEDPLEDPSVTSVLATRPDGAHVHRLGALPRLEGTDPMVMPAFAGIVAGWRQFERAGGRDFAFAAIEDRTVPEPVDVAIWSETMRSLRQKPEVGDLVVVHGRPDRYRPKPKDGQEPAETEARLQINAAAVEVVHMPPVSPVPAGAPFDLEHALSSMNMLLGEGDGPGGTTQRPAPDAPAPPSTPDSPAEPVGVAPGGSAVPDDTTGGFGPGAGTGPFVPAAAAAPAATAVCVAERPARADTSARQAESTTRADVSEAVLVGAVAGGGDEGPDGAGRLSGFL